MAESIRLSTVLPVRPQEVYDAWLDSEAHSAFTASAAEIEARVGGKHSAWDGYIWGTTQELEPGRRIVQTWRTTDFPKDAADSRLEVIVEPSTVGTKLTILHSEIPDGLAKEYRLGWQDNYFTPMMQYFARSQGQR